MDKFIHSVSSLSRFALIFPFLILFLQSCSKDTTPEKLIDDFVTACENSIEQGSSRKLRDLIAERYGDSSGRTKKDISSVASGYLLRNKSIYCVTLTDSVILNEDDSISARILAALAAQPITDISRLPTMNSDIYWFDIRIGKEGSEWKLLEASWRQAMLDDFFQ